MTFSEINMSTVNNVRVGPEAEVQGVCETDSDLVEVGTVLEETKGSIFGRFLDQSGGDWQWGP